LKVLRWANPKLSKRIHGYESAQKVLYVNLETTRLRGRPRNRWQDEVREDGRRVGREEWQKK
jgi:hypothetical protein